MPAVALKPLGVHDQCQLSDNEFVHLSQVLRLPVGEPIELVDGEGTVAQARIAAIAGKKALLTIDEITSFPPRHTPLITAIGALKPGFIDELLPVLTELGCDQLHVFLQAKVAKHRLQDKALLRWHNIAQAASKQCKRAFFPQISVWPSLDSFIAHASQQPWTRLYLQAGAPTALIDLPPAPPAGCCLVIGGEKGLEAQEEIALQGEGFTPAHLGPLILRAYTAILAATAIISGKRSNNLPVPAQPHTP